MLSESWNTLQTTSSDHHTAVLEKKRKALFQKANKIFAKLDIRFFFSYTEMLGLKKSVFNISLNGYPQISVYIANVS